MNLIIVSLFLKNYALFNIFDHIILRDNIDNFLFNLGYHFRFLNSLQFQISKSVKDSIGPLVALNAIVCIKPSLAMAVHVPGDQLPATEYFSLEACPFPNEQRECLGPAAGEGPKVQGNRVEQLQLPGADPVAVLGLQVGQLGDAGFELGEGQDSRPRVDVEGAVGDCDLQPQDREEQALGRLGLVEGGGQGVQVGEGQAVPAEHSQLEGPALRGQQHPVPQIVQLVLLDPACHDRRLTQAAAGGRLDRQHRVPLSDVLLAEVGVDSRYDLGVEGRDGGRVGQVG